MIGSSLFLIFCPISQSTFSWEMFDMEHIISNYNTWYYSVVQEIFILPIWLKVTSDVVSCTNVMHSIHILISWLEEAILTSRLNQVHKSCIALREILWHFNLDSEYMCVAVWRADSINVCGLKSTLMCGHHIHITQIATLLYGPCMLVPHKNAWRFDD